MHTQCLLVNENGATIISWIPSVRAKLDKVRIKGKIFTVKERYSSMPTEEVIANSSDYRRHRKATDIEGWKKLDQL